EMRDVPLRRRHVFGDAATKADDLDLLARAGKQFGGALLLGFLLCRPGGFDRRSRRARGQESVELGMADDAAGPGAHRREVDAESLGTSADGGRCQSLASTRSS